IWERDGALPLIFAGDNTGQFTCVDGSGKVIWQTETKPIFCASPAVGDLDNDGAMEVVQGDKSGLLYAFDALTGKPKWQTQLEGECGSAALADLNGDGTLEVVIATGAGKVYTLHAAGDIAWAITMDGTTADWATCAPIVVAYPESGRQIYAASGKERVYCLDAAGNKLWSRAVRGSVASTLSAGDIDSDGQIDVFAVTQLGIVYRFDKAGAVVWEIDTQGRSLAPAAIVDIDGDARLDFVLSTQNGNLLVFDSSGALQYSQQFKNRTINVTPAFGDIVRERPGLEFALTGGETGRVMCVGTDAAVGSRAEWVAYRGDNRNTASFPVRRSVTRPRNIPAGLAHPDEILTGDVLHFSFEAPANSKDVLTAFAVCMRPDGSQQRAIGRVAGTHGVLELPLLVTVEGVYRFEWGVNDEKGNCISKEMLEIRLRPLENDDAFVSRAIDYLRPIIDSVEHGNAPTSDVLRSELSRIEEDAKNIHLLRTNTAMNDTDGWNVILGKMAALNARCKRAIDVALVAFEVSKQKGRPLVAFEINSWDNRNTDTLLPKDAKEQTRILRRCVTGEHEPISIKLFNATSKSVSSKIRIACKREDLRFSTFTARSVATNLGDTAWDPLVSTADAPIEIPPRETREVWLDIDLANTKPGKVDVIFVAESDGAKEEVPIHLEILPLQMAGYDQMRMCVWAKYDAGAVKDLLAHGNTVFIGSLPSATIGEGASPAITCDFTELDEFLAPLKGHDVYLLFHGIPQLGVPMDSDEYVPRFAKFMEMFFVRLSEQGFDEKNVALYPYDEPGGNGWNTVKQYTAFARQALKACPGLKFYVNGGGDLAMFEEFATYAGVWSPSFYMLADQSPEMAVVRKSGKALWSYDCAFPFSRPVGANTKNINVVAQYRFSAPIAMYYGATGIGWWCYNHGPSMWDPIQFEYPLVYENPDGTSNTSRRWEAVREGVEDARILIALRDKLGDASVSAEVKEKITHLLETSLPALSQQTMDEALIGVARYVIDATHNDDTVTKFRDEMMDCVAAVAK
ncbi:MAG: PQQ-binding-like beta-propeller repeat protein, partial [Candidatus Hydrogenedentes bacterium]|nr:PQQ-binding-like beta-propeller repeat protein [Candidatus Hydrogenedentota bacterium]